MADIESLPPDAPRPRLCHLHKWPNFPGYGFNLHAEKTRTGQYIGKVDPGSPAEAAGLREGDRIVEVNGTNIAMENHQQVVERIKAVSDETKFLVVDESTDNYYRDRKIVVCGRMDNVQVIEAPAHVMQPTGDVSDGNGEPDAGRVCKLRKWPEFIGYGFNLHAEADRPGQYVDQVDPGSPAEASGLREGDRIIAVNDVDVLGMSHQDVVGRIKSQPDSVTLFVVDAAVQRDLSESGVPMSLAAIKHIEILTCPEVNPRITTTSGPTDSGIHTGSDVLPPVDEHRPRLCHVRSWHDGKGFGFNMLSQKGAADQFIGTVDRGSPAEVAGLREGDRIIEVNGHNIEKDDHKQVVQRIREIPEETRLLVVDAATDKYFKSKGITIEATSDSVLHMSSPDKPLASDTSTIEENDPKPVATADYEQITNEITEMAIRESAAISETASNIDCDKTVFGGSLEMNGELGPSSIEPKLLSSKPSTPKTAVSIAGLEFAGSAEEARRRMSKKKDVKSISMTIKDKYDLFQKL